MIYSMTGYANQTVQIKGTILQIDIRSVNHRFLDLTIKCPEEFKPLEQELRDKITAKISRGKLDLRINEQNNQTTNNSTHINQNFLNNYVELTKHIQKLMPEACMATTAEIINTPGILIKDTLDITLIKPALLEATSLLVENLLQSQTAEGEKLKQILLNKAQQILQIVSNARDILPTVLNEYKNKLKLKLAEVMGDISISEQRFQQEFAYFCQKFDVDEELSRLEAHLEQFKHLINNGGIIGKKIDFLIQEMHREANTFGAKSISIDTTNSSVELKVLIEQMKEQVQNIA